MPSLSMISAAVAASHLYMETIFLCVRKADSNTACSPFTWNNGIASKRRCFEILLRFLFSPDQIPPFSIEMSDEVDLPTKVAPRECCGE